MLGYTEASSAPSPGTLPRSSADTYSTSVCDCWQSISPGVCVEVTSPLLGSLYFPTRAACLSSCSSSLPTGCSGGCPPSQVATADCGCVPCSTLESADCPSTGCRLSTASDAASLSLEFCLAPLSCIPQFAVVCGIPKPFTSSLFWLAPNPSQPTALSLATSADNYVVALSGPAGFAVTESEARRSAALTFTSWPCWLPDQYDYYYVESLNDPDIYPLSASNVSSVPNACGSCSFNSEPLAIGCNYCVCISGTYVCTRLDCPKSGQVTTYLQLGRSGPSTADAYAVIESRSSFVESDAQLELLCSLDMSECWLVVVGQSRDETQFSQAVTSSLGEGWTCLSCESYVDAMGNSGALLLPTLLPALIFVQILL